MPNNGEIKVELKGGPQLTAMLKVPEAAKGLVIFAHGSGSSRFSPRNNFVADVLNEHQMATLLTDLLTPSEDVVFENRFNINLLSNRLIKVSEWSMEQAALRQLPVGYFGASTGAAAALQAAALNKRIEAVVSRGGRPDLSKNLSQVQAPTLLIIGSLDTAVIELNKQAYDELRCEKRMEIVQGASHLFEEPGTLDSVSNLAADWFERYLIRNGKFSGSPL
ncbi:dienelactone hydrolase family protein [Chitinophaga sp. HK235]|uniref:dienelactone hydrolase family protein n=1 Tax=Chitinophaga sp. HK235 TaxID=2952571 RepID=UPI001BA62555|nr:alpha/beta hydrolase [Chitinophaga sp. HK235]